MVFHTKPSGSGEMCVCCGSKPSFLLVEQVMQLRMRVQEVMLTLNHLRSFRTPSQSREMWTVEHLSETMRRC